ncbi:MAG: carboxymuconolactone decarboxylase family protein [Rickettsiales bacterium]|nr:carboxymuconolactone decarboxylase family protein [Rickettsiales bacterium]
MSIKEIRSQLGEYAKDIKLNLGNVLSEEGAAGLDANQIAGIALASACATKNVQLIEAVTAEASERLSAEEVQAAKAAATIMGMNNIYYRFVHLVSDGGYMKMPANLRMNVIANPGIDKVTFELESLAVSAITGCGMCIDAHVREVEKAGISKQGVQSTIRIAAVINATAQALVIG